MDVVYNYSVNNFLDLTSKDIIIIKDKNGKNKYNLSPFELYYYVDGRYLILKIDQTREVRLDFVDNNSALSAIRMFDNKIRQVKNYLVPSGKTYFTKAESEQRFVNSSGDLMTGDLGIRTNLRVSGDTYLYGNLHFSGSTGLVTSLSELSDTLISGLTNDDVLLYNSTDDKWKNRKLASLSGGTSGTSGIDGTSGTSGTNGDIRCWGNFRNRWYFR